MSGEVDIIAQLLRANTCSPSRSRSVAKRMKSAGQAVTGRIMSGDWRAVRGSNPRFDFCRTRSVHSERMLYLVSSDLSVAQWNRAKACGALGRRFESCSRGQIRKVAMKPVSFDEATKRLNTLIRAWHTPRKWSLHVDHPWSQDVRELGAPLRVYVRTPSGFLTIPLWPGHGVAGGKPFSWFTLRPSKRT